MCILIKKYNICTRVLSQHIIGTSSIAYESNHECVFSFVKFAREVKVTTMFHCSIKYGSFPSLCTSEKHVSVVFLYEDSGNGCTFKYNDTLYVRNIT